MSDSAPEMEAYLDLVPEDLIRRLAVGLDLFDPRLGELTGEQADTAFLEKAGVGRWPVRVVVGHLADGELINTCRLRRAVAEEGVIAQGWDPQPYIDAGLYGVVSKEADGEPMKGLPIAGSLATIHTVRAWACEWLSTLDRAAWDRRFLHETRGAFTVRSFCGLHLWHFERHTWFLNKKIEKLLAPGGPGEG